MGMIYELLSQRVVHLSWFILFFISSHRHKTLLAYLFTM